VQSPWSTATEYPMSMEARPFVRTREHGRHPLLASAGSRPGGRRDRAADWVALERSRSARPRRRTSGRWKRDRGVRARRCHYARGRRPRRPRQSGTRIRRPSAKRGPRRPLRG
jgi:hypothetical protein